jgi:hypothetical protein
LNRIQGETIMKRCLVTAAVGVALLLGSANVYSQRFYTNVDKPMSFADSMRVFHNVQRSRLVAIANQVPEDKYFVKPPAAGELRGEEQSIGHLIAEAANTQWRMCTIILTGGRPSEDAQPGTQVFASGKPTKAAMVAALMKSFETCEPIVANFEDANVLKPVMSQYALQPLGPTIFNVISHNREIFGKLMSYIVIMGLPRPTGTVNAVDPNNRESLIWCGGKPASKTPDACTYVDFKK